MERVIRKRTTRLVVLLVMLLGYFCLRLYSSQVVDAQQNESNLTVYTIRTRVRAARGDILDTNGNVLVTNRASYDLVFNHYVLLKSDNTNQSLLELAKLCKSQGIEYYDHFPITEETPFAYTLGDYNSAWQGYFQKFLESRGNMDSDISAPLLVQELRDQYGIPEDWSDEDARLVLGLRYEISLRNGITNLPNYVLIEDASEEERAAILELNTPGLRVEASTVREYNTEYAAHILGYTGAMSSKQWETYKEKGYEMDALVGQSGFELAFEEYLHGTDGIRVDEVTKDGTILRSYYEVEPKSGNNVEVTIDLRLQMAAEDALAKALDELRDSEVNTSGSGLDAEGGAVLAIDIKTGEVLVCGSYPTYDPATLFQNYNEILQADYAPLLNRALNAIYPPGSTYKMCMVVTGINNGYIDRNTVIYDKGIYTKYSDFCPTCLIYSNSNGTRTHGDVNCTYALQCSCNYFFYELADRMRIEQIDEVAKGLGLGEYTGVELSEYLGYRSNPDTKKSLFDDPDQSGWYAADQVLTGIGQSYNRFTPMQMAVYVSTLCNQGVRYSATFLNRVVASDYTELLYEKQPQILSTTYISDAAYEAVMEGMRLVTSADGGTAYSAFRDYPIAVAGKTGTAETDSGSPNGAFVCFAPYDDPQIAIVVYGEKAGGGSRLTSVAKAILDIYFDVDTGYTDSYENKVS